MQYTTEHYVSQDIRTELVRTGQFWIERDAFSPRRDDTTEFFEVVLLGESFGSVCGYTRAFDRLQNVATRRGIDLYAARRTYLAAVEMETQIEAHRAQLENDCPDFNAEVEVLAEVLAERMTQSAARPHYCDTPRASRADYVAGLRDMFGSARLAELDTDDRDNMIRGINELLGLNVQSRTQLTPDELQTVSDALLNDCFTADWTVNWEVATDYLRHREVTRTRRAA